MTLPMPLFRKLLFLVALALSTVLLKDCDGHWQGVQPAYGHDDSHPHAEWFKMLKQPDHPQTSCCGPSDAFDVDEYHPDPEHPGGFIARVGAVSYHVPAAKVNWADPNIFPYGIIFLSLAHYEQTEAYVYCFVPAAGY